MSKSNIKFSLSIIGIITLFAAVLLCVSCMIPAKVIGVAWDNKDNTTNALLSLEKASNNIKAEVLPLVKYEGFTYDGDQVTGDCIDNYGMLTNAAAEQLKAKPYDKTNVAEVVKGHDAIVFTGGPDIAPSLYKNPQPYYDLSKDPGFNPTRDISDYILMSYCLDNNIKCMGICRGMQLYAVASGAEMIQDLPTYYASKGIPYNAEHQKSGEINGEAVRGNHPVYVTDKTSFLYDCVKTDVIDKPYSSHHQAVLSVDPAKSKVTAVGRVNGVETIEALERADSDTFSFFTQFHPEHALARWVNDTPDKESFMSYETALSFFKYFIDHI